MKSRKIWVWRGIVALFFIAAPAFGTVDEPPASVSIGSLSHLYSEVVFDHDLHLSVTDDCSVCHHHRFGKGVKEERCARCHSESQGTFSARCSDCHVEKPFSVEHIMMMEADPKRYHIDMTGLKGAYHLKCYNCHAAMGAPSECGDCHARSDAGDRFYHSGIYAPAGGSPTGKHE
ncbi:MAG: cytochrome c3 family protein [Deltaproteobacteria bacterium]|nr:cytochrome c3 family protein [Deltaproteobacteria bacterium]